MNNTMIRMTGGLVDEDDSLISRINIKNLSGEIKSIIFDSFASLDDNNVEDCFGLDIETAMKATESSPSLKQHPMYETLSTLANASAGCEKTPSRSGASDDTSSNNSVTSANDDSTKPKRPLSAYNLFFQLERERIIAGIDHTPFNAEDVERVALARRISDMQPEKPKRKHRKSHGKITFAELARAIANRWRALDAHSKGLLLERAAIEKSRFLRELEEWTLINGEDEDFDKKEPSRLSEVLITSKTSSVTGKLPASQRAAITKAPFPDSSVSSQSRPPMHPPNRTITPDIRMKCAMEMAAFANMRITNSSASPTSPFKPRHLSSAYKSYQQQLSNQPSFGSRFDSSNINFYRQSQNNDFRNNFNALNSRNHQSYLFLQEDIHDSSIRNHVASHSARDIMDGSTFLLENEIYNSQLQNDFAFSPTTTTTTADGNVGGMHQLPSVRSSRNEHHHNPSRNNGNMDHLLANVEYELCRSKMTSDKLAKLLSSLHRQNSTNKNDITNIDNNNTNSDSFNDYQGNRFM